MLTFIRSGIQIPSADTLRRDLNENFNSAKDIFRQVLQVNNFNIYNDIKLIFY